jgi:hypothetical protein
MSERRPPRSKKATNPGTVQLPSVCVSQTSAANYAAIALADRTANALCRGELSLLIAIDAYCSSNRHEGIDMATLIVAAATFLVL